MAKNRRQSLIAALALCCVQAPSWAATVHIDNFIADDTRTNFNGFEQIPVDLHGEYVPAFDGQIAGPYVEDGIAVEERIMDGYGYDPIIYTDAWLYVFTGGYTEFDRKDGERSWFQGRGGSVYTQITRTDGSPFSSVGFRIGSGSGGLGSGDPVLAYYYQLLLDGKVVQSGVVDPGPGSYARKLQFLGFSGGGFDTIRVSDNKATENPTGFDGRYSLFALDSIELTGAIPEPATWLLMGLGLAGAAAVRVRGSHG